MSDSRRTSPRDNAFVFAAVRLQAGAEPVECMVWDISPDGAMIEVPDVGPVPDRISLTLPGEGAGRSATVIWREGRRFGLRF
jgi:hypothetical protein